LPRLAQILAPNEREYFDLFEQAGANIVRAAGLLEVMLDSYPDHRELTSVIHDCEHEGDRITHDVIQRLNQTFVTPFDREDIYELVSVLDDVVDITDEVADYLGVYKIEAPMEQSQQLGGILAQAARHVADALAHLRGFRDITRYTVEVHRLENEADRIVRDAVGALFVDGIDPMVVIRWKDIYERLENAIDATERAAYIIEGIVIKNA
jgi:predicted phosphate transport protein (TIGR00153 family)